MVCAYGKCKETYELTKENAIQIKKRYYHTECHRKTIGKASIRDLYINRVSKTVVVAMLVKVINSIIDDKNISVEYLYFALRYAINHGYKINFPMALHYLIDDDKIRVSYEKFQLKNKNKENSTAPIEEPKEVSFTIETVQKNTWNLFG